MLTLIIGLVLPIVAAVFDLDLIRENQYTIRSPAPSYERHLDHKESFVNSSRTT